MIRIGSIALFVALALPDVTIAQERGTVGSPDDTQDGAVLGIFADSLKLLILEHGIQWQDTDGWAVNYIGHPIHGAAAGYIWLDRKPGVPKAISVDSGYWTSRATATAWSAAYSIQFEIGPFSEASVGNVGMRPETAGWVDHVVTPVGAFGFMVAEDALDRYVVRWAERRVQNALIRIIIRFAANPSRTLSNTASGKFPWHRPDRTLTWRHDE